MLRTLIFSFLIVFNLYAQVVTPTVTPTPVPTPVPLPPTSAFLSLKGVPSYSIWAPKAYTTGFTYDVVYYIPSTIDLKVPNKVLVMLHGGGTSTLTRLGSLEVTTRYIKPFVKLANELNVIVVWPSASGLNWGDHMRFMLKELNAEIKSKVNVNSNYIALAGHSMGGMGITRSAHWLASEYNFIMPLAAGMDERHQSENNLWTNFNTIYFHINGLKDDFTEFQTRALNEQKAMQALEAKYQKKSGYRLEFHEGGHQMDMPLVTARMKALFTMPRNLYQKELFGSFLYVDTITSEREFTYNRKPTSEYFWLEVKEWDPAILPTEAIRVDVHAKIVGNLIDIKLSTEHKIKTLRVYLTHRLVDLSLPVFVQVNGVIKSGKLKILNSEEKTTLKKTKNDNKFVFERWLDVNLM